MGLTSGEEILSANEVVGFKPNKEFGNTFPEVIANPPLKNTSLIYSVPVRGEWKNGHLMRMLKGMFSQHTDKNEPVEVELVMNIGKKLNDIIKQQDFQPVTDEKGRILLEDNIQTDSQRQAYELLQETKESMGYLKTIVEAQKLARSIVVNPNDKKASSQLAALMAHVTDPIQKDVLQLAVKQAETINLAVIDASYTLFAKTDYRPASIHSLRTLGADVAYIRFEQNPNAVLNFYDADTVHENNDAFLNMQKIYKSKPRLMYMFSGLSGTPAGHSKAFVADSPRELLRKVEKHSVDDMMSRSSSQISFRLKAYDTLQEISGFTDPVFTGGEDYDTAYRLVYHFGNLQDGLLYDNDPGIYASTVLPADRINGSTDGNFDSAGRSSEFEKTGVQLLTENLECVFASRQRVSELIEKAPMDKREEIGRTLQSSREHFQKRQKVQQRFNRMVMRSFLEAQQAGLIACIENKLTIDSEKIMRLSGGTALVHYIHANPDLIQNFLSSPEDMDVMRYFVGLSTKKPDGALTPFQRSIREYVGEVLSVDILLKDGLISGKEINNEQHKWEGEDMRTGESQVSVMHASIAEMLALGHVYRTFFETTEFRKKIETKKSTWPDDSTKQELTLNFGNLQDRLKKIKKAFASSK
jgi:hypothetical protein